MAKRRGRQSTLDKSATMTTEGTEQERGGNQVSNLFTTVEQDVWREHGGGGQAEKGLYVNLLEQFIGTGERFAEIDTRAAENGGGGGYFQGKNAASVTSAIKAARKHEKAPAGAMSVKVSSKGGIVFLENEAVEE